MMQKRRSKAVQDFWVEKRQTRAFEADSYVHATTLSDPVLSTAVDQLAELAATGRKVATSHLELDFVRNAIPFRAVGDPWVILNSKAMPRCLVRVTQILERPFSAVDEETALAEGGGDLSISYWRDAHERYFRKQCENWGEAWSPELTVITEFFELA